MAIRIIHRTFGVVLALLAAGCVSVPTTRFYTLSVLSEPFENDASRSSLQSRRPIFIEVMPVKVPERLARPQLVVRAQGSGQETQLLILEQDRWSSHFNQELRDALATGIANQVGAINEGRGLRVLDRPSYRIAIVLSQFDAIVGDKVQARFSWAITRSTDGLNAMCHSTMSEPAGGGIAGVVKGIQRAASSVAADISKNLIEMDTGQAPTCAIQNKAN
ncbi:MAG: PqiC family protein [Pseudomonadota bacterium]|nr:PqiC family protein [Pseudomonadota bacterium]